MTVFALTVHAEGDPEEADRLARRLRSELSALDLEEVDLVKDGAVPPLAKSVDPATVTTILVAAATSPVLVQLAGTLRDWVNRGRHRKIVVKTGNRSIEITGTSARDNRRAIEAFFREETEEPERPLP